MSYEPASTSLLSALKASVFGGSGSGGSGSGGSGSSSRIVATKVIGDPNVPAGEVSWWADSVAMPHPWPQQELDLVERWAVGCSANAPPTAYLFLFYYLPT